MNGTREERQRIQARRMPKNRRDSVFSSNATNRAMKSDITICLDKASYVAGEVISGHVNVLLTQDIKIKELTIRLQGYSRVFWDEQRSYTKGISSTVSRKHQETYLDQVVVLLKKESEEGVFIPPGDHNFPFKCALPHGLPSSFDGKHGHIRYTAKTVLERPWKFDIEREKDFTLRALTDLNEEPELARPIGALGDFTTGIWCLNNGVVNIELRLNRRGFVPGESIQAMVEIENNTSHQLHGIRLTLQQHVTFRIGTKTRSVTQTLAAISKGEVAKSETALWENEFLEIPSEAPPSTHKSVRAIRIKYTVTLHVTFSSWREEYTLPVVIIIGTQSFRMNVLQAFSNLMACCNPTPAPTPGTTPVGGRRTQTTGTANDALLPKGNPALTSGTGGTKLQSPAHQHHHPMMTRDQMCMRRASAFPVMTAASSSLPAAANKQSPRVMIAHHQKNTPSLSSNPSAESLQATTANDALSSDNPPSQPINNLLSPLLAQQNNPTSRRRLSGSDAASLALREPVTLSNCDITLILEGERLNKPSGGGKNKSAKTSDKSSNSSGSLTRSKENIPSSVHDTSNKGNTGLKAPRTKRMSLDSIYSSRLSQQKQSSRPDPFDDGGDLPAPKERSSSLEVSTPRRPSGNLCAIQE